MANHWWKTFIADNGGNEIALFTLALALFGGVLFRHIRSP